MFLFSVTLEFGGNGLVGPALAIFLFSVTLEFGGNGLVGPALAMFLLSVTLDGKELTGNALATA
jgi:hypothetical protein